VSGSSPPHFGRQGDGSPESGKLSAKFIVVNWPGDEEFIFRVKKRPLQKAAATTALEIVTRAGSPDPLFWGDVDRGASSFPIHAQSAGCATLI
jgi:hypothetical protein